MAEDKEEDEKAATKEANRTVAWLGAIVDLLAKIHRLGVTGLCVAAFFGYLYMKDKNQNRLDRLEAEKQYVAAQKQYTSALLTCVASSKSEHSRTRKEIKQAVEDATPQSATPP